LRYININEENPIESDQKTQEVSVEKTDVDKPFKIDLSSAFYTEVVDPELITVNEV
jgi:hypothetical protein